MPGRSETSPHTPRRHRGAWDRHQVLSVLHDPDLIATTGIAAIGLLITTILIHATDGADLALAFLAPLN
jgi:hypothetical protein